MSASARSVVEVLASLPKEELDRLRHKNQQALEKAKSEVLLLDLARKQLTEAAASIARAALAGREETTPRGEQG